MDLNPSSRKMKNNQETWRIWILTRRIQIHYWRWSFWLKRRHTDLNPQAYKSIKWVITVSSEKWTNDSFLFQTFFNSSKMVPNYKWDFPTLIEGRESSPKIQIFILSKESEINWSIYSFSLKHSSHFSFKAFNYLIINHL